MKMLDPLGHLPRRVIAEKSVVAVVWASDKRRHGIASALAETGVTPLLATAFRHVRTSVHDVARPKVSLVIVDFDALSETDITELMSLRWEGYRGLIVAICTPGTLERKMEAMLDIDLIVRHDDPTFARSIRDRVQSLGRPRGASTEAPAR